VAGGHAPAPLGSASGVLVKDCQRYFGIDLPSIVLTKRQDKFVARCKYAANPFCVLLH